MALPDRFAASAQRLLASQLGPGTTLTLIRSAGLPGAGSYPVAGWVTDFIADDLQGAVEQGRRSAILLASSVAASGWVLPFMPRQDRLQWNGNTLVVMSIDDATGNIQGVPVRYDIELEGA